DALQDLLALAFGRSLRALQRLFGFFHPGLEPFFYSNIYFFMSKTKKHKEHIKAAYFLDMR
ncbi:hypothetical protein, partial [Ottowia cancrivicina]